MSLACSLCFSDFQQDNGTWRIGIATAQQPQGPFVDTGVPLDGLGGIDPMVFIDDDGEAYIYSNDHQVAKLKPNMVELAEKPRSIDYAPSWVLDNPELAFEEGSYMHKYNGKYIYSYSNWQEDNTTAYYGIGDSPYGPFQWQGALAPATRGAPDHHSMIEFQGQWYYFYHMDTPWQDKIPLDWYGHRRLACFDKLYHNRDATIQMIQRTYGHVKTALGINAGSSSSYAVTDGTAYYESDQYNVNTGETASSDAAIAGTSDEFLYQTARFGSWFKYEIPLDNGVYRVTLQFAELVHEEAGLRRFSVSAEDTEIITDLDVFFMVGKNAAFDEVHTVDVMDGSLTLEFTAIVDKAQVNAIFVNKLEDITVDKGEEDACSPDPCAAGFICMDLGGSEHECRYTDPCENEPCQVYETCMDLGLGKHACVYNNPCDALSPCESNERCLDLGGGDFECQPTQAQTPTPAPSAAKAGEQLNNPTDQPTQIANVGDNEAVADEDESALVDDDESIISMGLIVGVAVAGAVLVLIFTFALKRRRRKQSAGEKDGGSTITVSVSNRKSTNSIAGSTDRSEQTC